MNGFGDSIGTVIEGGLLGHAVEPGAGETSGKAGVAAICANCSTQFTGHFCPQCGQKAHLHRSLAAIGHDIMHGVLHLDGKLWHTLPQLAFKPGALTRRYVAGERAKFVSPMAMFLFTVFAMFAVFQMVGLSAPADFGQGFVSAFGDDDGAGSAFRTNIQTQITDLEKERGGLAKSDPRRDAIDAEVKILNGMVRDNPVSDAAGETLAGPTGVAFLDDKIIAKWNKNPSLMLYKLQSNGYKFSWLLIPLSLPFVWLMFAWRRQYKAYDHAVFVTYSLSFMSLLFIMMSIVSVTPLGTGWAWTLFAIGAPLHLYKQLRYAYGLSRFSAMWRFVMLTVFVQIVAVLFLLALSILGAF